MSRHRRAFVAGLGITLGSLAGCSQPADESGEVTTEPGDERTVTDTETGPSGTSTETPDLDLQEANVVAVTVDSAGDGQYRFDVTLFHDDDGEDGYANWWQVETLERERLGRRELLHAHSTDPFTRSETIEIPGGTTCVVVRGHDQTHGYGGQAMVVDVESGATRTVQQGGEAGPVSTADCPEQSNE